MDLPVILKIHYKIKPNPAGRYDLPGLALGVFYVNRFVSPVCNSQNGGVKAFCDFQSQHFRGGLSRWAISA